MSRPRHFIICPRIEPEADPYDYEPPEPPDYEDDPPLSDHEPPQSWEE